MGFLTSNANQLSRFCLTSTVSYFFFKGLFPVRKLTFPVQWYEKQFCFRTEFLVALSILSQDHVLLLRCSISLTVFFFQSILAMLFQRAHDFAIKKEITWLQQNQFSMNKPPFFHDSGRMDNSTEQRRHETPLDCRVQEKPPLLKISS